MIKNTFTSLGILVAACAAAAYSCSSSTTGLDTTGLGNPSGGKGGASGASGSNSGPTGGTTGDTSGGTTSGGSSSGGTAPIFMVDAGQTPDGSMEFDEDAACGTGEVGTMLKQVDMFVMFDRSWSMRECGDGSQTPQTGGELVCPNMMPSRWDLAAAALVSFFQDPRSADLGVALRFFPSDVPAAGCNGYMTGGPVGGGMFGGNPMGGGMFGTAGASGFAGASGTAGASGAAGPNCDVNACAQPQVDIGKLLADAAPVDAHEAALVAAVAAATPPGPAMPNPNPSTPTSAALGGAEQWAVQHQGTRTDLQTVVVLITDGQPQGCDMNLTNISRLASDANDSAGILTYVIGLLGSDQRALDGLNQVAAAGGTEKAIFVQAGGMAQQQLLDALIAIKGMALSCELDVPKSTESGMMIDPRLINVKYSGNELGYVESMAACGAEPAWYFDDPANPTKAILCPQTCATVKADTNATLRIAAGCKPHIVTR